MRKLKCILAAVFSLLCMTAVLTACGDKSEPQTYTVTVVYNDGATQDLVSEPLNAGDSFTLPQAATRAGYVFVGWQRFGVSYAAGTTVEVKSNMSYTAVWDKLYKVTYALDGGEGSFTQPDVVSGAKVTLPASEPTKTDYAFSGWKVTYNGTQTVAVEEGAFNMPAADVTVTAQWTRDYTITFDLDGGEGTFSLANTAAGKAVTMPEGKPTKTDAVFAGWQLSYTLGGAEKTARVDSRFIMPAANVKITALWTQLYAISFELAGGSGEFSLPKTAAGETVTLPETEPVRTNFIFSGWTVTYHDGTEDKTVFATGGSFRMPAYAVKITATWEEKSNPDYAVVYNLAGGTGEFAAGASKAGATVTLSATEPERSGYAFKGWKVTYIDTLDGGKEKEVTVAANNTFTMPAFNVRVSAQWAALYKIVFDYAGGDGSFELPAKEAGEQVTIRSGAPVRAGYTFKEWKAYKDNGAATPEEIVLDNGAFTMPACRVKLVAQWDVNTYTITFDSNVTDTDGIPADTASGEFGTSYTITAKPSKIGYVFKEWKVFYVVDEKEVVVPNYNGTFYIPASHVIAQAVMALQPNKIVFDLAGGEGIFALPEASAGDTVTLPAATPTQAGYLFKGWTVTYNDGTEDRTVTVTEGAFEMPAYEVKITAQWAVAYEITYVLNEGTYTGAEVAAEGDAVTLGTPTKEGFDFAGWTVVYNNGTEDVTLALDENKFTMPAFAVTATASWEAIEYTFTFTHGETPLVITYAYGAKLSEGTNYPAQIEGKDNLPFAYWVYEKDNETIGAFTGKTLARDVAKACGGRTLTLKPFYAILVGKADFSNGYPEMKPEVESSISVGQVVTISGTMTSKAEENWQTVLAYLFNKTDENPDPAGLFRFDWWVADGTTEDELPENVAGDPVGWHPQHITQKEGWKIVMAGEFNWPDNVNHDYSTFRATIAHCTFTIKVDWTYSNKIVITMTAVGLDNNITQKMVYTITPSGDAFAVNTYAIGLAAEASCGVFTKFEVHEHTFDGTTDKCSCGQLNPLHGDPDAVKAGNALDHKFGVDNICEICGAVNTHEHTFVNNICTVCDLPDYETLDGAAVGAIDDYDAYKPNGNVGTNWFADPTPIITASGNFVIKLTYDQGSSNVPGAVFELVAYGKEEATKATPYYFDANPNDLGVWGAISTKEDETKLNEGATLNIKTSGDKTNVAADANQKVVIYVWRTDNVLGCYYEVKATTNEVVYSFIVVLQGFVSDIVDLEHLTFKAQGMKVGTLNWKAYGSENVHVHAYGETTDKCSCGKLNPLHGDAEAVAAGKALDHNYVDNACTICGDIQGHTHNYVNGYCDGCKSTCKHETLNNEVCDECNLLVRNTNAFNNDLFTGYTLEKGSKKSFVGTLESDMVQNYHSVVFAVTKGWSMRTDNWEWKWEEQNGGDGRITEVTKNEVVIKDSSGSTINVDWWTTLKTMVASNVTWEVVFDWTGDTIEASIVYTAHSGEFEEYTWCCSYTLSVKEGITQVNVQIGAEACTIGLKEIEQVTEPDPVQPSEPAE